MREPQSDHPAHRRIRQANRIDRLTWGTPAPARHLTIVAESSDTPENESEAV